ncbi:uncharacterized protein LOC131858748 [Cryptomeria japonica]|uniref:uncharacterized protein LOC131858748 n=1 Tax=Cryptomeria japonica TaxID=3369 RepID=UPI0027DA9463|nr:uncharacterized protein LOC131858748 [Cryptomeria japonica]
MAPHRQQSPSSQRFVVAKSRHLEIFEEQLADCSESAEIYADQRRVERSFEVGDMVYLRLQPYRQSNPKKSGAEKLKPRFYRPFQVIRKVGVVAYELELPSSSKVHNVFHVSRLKKALGHNVIASSQLPPLDEEGQLILILEEIIDSRERSLRRRTIKEYLVRWKNLPLEDATWENKEILREESAFLPGVTAGNFLGVPDK